MSFGRISYTITASALYVITQIKGGGGGGGGGGGVYILVIVQFETNYKSVQWCHCLLIIFRHIINRPNSQIPQGSCPISHNAPFRTEMNTFLFWMVYCGIWDSCVVRFGKDWSIAMSLRTIILKCFNTSVQYTSRVQLDVTIWHIYTRYQATCQYSAISFGEDISQIHVFFFQFNQLTMVKWRHMTS